MKIVRLSAENVKRLKAVEIEPDGTLQVVTGRNAQGKSSVLDAIWLALGGGVAAKSTPRPVRDGETKASVELDLGDLVVTRTWVGEKTALTVKNADGAKYSSPQAMLDKLIGRLSFDPLAFTRLSAKEQRTALLDLVELDIDLAAVDAERAKVFDARTDIGRQGKALGTPAAIDNDLPTEELSSAAIVAEIERVNEQNRRHERTAEAVAITADCIKATEEDISRAEEELSRLKALLAEQNENYLIASDLHASLPEEQSTEALREQLTNAEETNRAIRANEAAKVHAAQVKALKAKYDTLTEKLASIDQRKADALAKAEFPVDGLGFDDTGVTYQGVPFAQASSAEQIRVSLAMAMALNPDLRVIRIMDGSLLDAESMQQITELASERDYQLWVERVSDPSESAVVIEDGQVVDANEAAA